MNEATITTEDGGTITTGERAFNYYDRKPGAIEALDGGGWFTFRHEDGTSAYLNGERVCTIGYAINKGWATPAVCSFCGGNAMPIHDESVSQYGEPVCTVCYEASMAEDPTNDDPYRVLVHLNLGINAASEADAMAKAERYVRQHGITSEVIFIEVV